MKSILRDTGKFLKRNIFHFNCSDFLRDRDYGLYVEDYFHEMVYIERKRAERSKSSFVLMLIDFDPVLGDGSVREIIKGAALAVSASTREIDIKGWYKHNHVLGVVFTDTGSSGVAHIRDKISREIASDQSIGRITAEKLRISFHVFPDEKKTAGNAPLDFKLYPDLVKKNSFRKKPLFAKRVIDIIGVVAGLVIFSPFFILIPLAIKLTSKGPVFYSQKRIGEFGRPFTFLKFRSMYADNDDRIHNDYVKKLILEEKAFSAEEGGEKVYKIQNDPRVTPFGRFLRKTSLDELPQFFNVLSGDMSLVGPRPPIPYELENYDIWHWKRVFEVKPGITGLWQVKGRSKTTFNEMVRMDIMYIDMWSLWLDMKIILLTPFSMLTSKGAY